jgi:hypothetical protein
VPVLKAANRRFGPKSSRRNEGVGIRTKNTMKIHSALELLARNIFGAGSHSLVRKD